VKKWLAFIVLITITLAFAYGAIDWKGLVLGDTESGQDTELTEEEAALTANGEEKKVVISGLGMVCVSCEATMNAIMKEMNHISAFHVNLRADRVAVVYDPNIISLEEIKEHIKDRGGRIDDVQEVQL
jgi:copper chaperone CopZ